MSLFSNIFSNKSADQAQPAPQQANSGAGQPGNIPPPTQTTPPLGTSPTPISDTSSTAKVPGSDSPLAQFSSLWENDTKTEGTKPPANTSLTQEELQKVMSKQNFSTSITPEQLAAISAGGEGAQTAFAAAMNSVAQNVMVQSTLVNNKLLEQALAKQAAQTTANLPELYRQQVSKASNPLFSNPAIRPVVEATQERLLAKFPNASASEITQMTQDYIIAMGKEFAPKEVVNNNTSAETDWEAFMAR